MSAVDKTLSFATPTEEDMLRLLRARYTEKTGNGDAWAFVPHVRNAAGFNATRTADAIAMALWPSRGLVLHGFEVKVSRGDWVRELKKPEKAEVFCSLVDFWWLVVADPDIVRDGELPPDWGLLARQGKRKPSLRVLREATRLRAADKNEPVSRSFLACLLRAATKVSEAGPAEIIEALEKQRSEMSASHQVAYTRLEQDIQTLRDRIRQFEAAAGIQIDETTWKGEGGRTAEETGKLMRMVLDGEAQTDNAERRLRSIARQARELADHINMSLPEQTP